MELLITCIVSVILLTLSVVNNFKIDGTWTNQESISAIVLITIGLMVYMFFSEKKQNPPTD